MEGWGWGADSPCLTLCIDTAEKLVEMPTLFPEVMLPSFVIAFFSLLVFEPLGGRQRWATLSSGAWVRVTAGIFLVEYAVICVRAYSKM